MIFNEKENKFLWLGVLLLVIDIKKSKGNTMTLEEFNSTGWTGGMKATYKGTEYDVLAVDFELKTIDLINDDGIEDNLNHKEVCITKY